MKCIEQVGMVLTCFDSQSSNRKKIPNPSLIWWHCWFNTTRVCMSKKRVNSRIPRCSKTFPFVPSVLFFNIHEICSAWQSQIDLKKTNVSITDRSLYFFVFLCVFVSFSHVVIVQWPNVEPEELHCNLRHILAHAFSVGQLSKSLTTNELW